MILPKEKVLEKLACGNFVSKIVSICSESFVKLQLHQFEKLIYEISDKTRSSTMRILKYIKTDVVDLMSKLEVKLSLESNFDSNLISQDCSHYLTNGIYDDNNL